MIPKILVNKNNCVIVRGLHLDGREILVLFSYETLVAWSFVDEPKVHRIWSGWSLTTGRHINEFCRILRAPIPTKKEWESLPVEDDDEILV